MLPVRYLLCGDVYVGNHIQVSELRVGCLLLLFIAVLLWD